MENWKNKGIVAGGIILLVLWWSWSSIVSGVIRGDLEDYARQVRFADLPLYEKEKVLELTDDLEDFVDDGRRVGLLRWRRTDAVVRELLMGGLNEEKARLIERELKQVQREIILGR